MSEYYYELKNNHYKLICKDGNRIDIHYGGTQIAICYDESCWTLLKHGSAELVLKKAQRMWKEYMKNGLVDIAQDIRIITLPKNFPAEEINKCINTYGYVEKLVDKLKGDQNEKGT